MSAIAKYKDELARLKLSKSSAISKVKSKAGRIQHEIIANSTAYVVGAADSQNKNPLPDVFGLNKKLVWGIVAHAIAANVNGKAGEIMGSIGTGLTVSYSYCAGAGKGYTLEGQYTYQDVSGVGAQENFVVDDIEV
jgi:hypothetical protein